MMMSQVNESEIRQIIADVMRDTGIRIDADDPVVAMIIMQRREMADWVVQHQKQQQFFLDELTKKATAIVGSADAFSQQKKLVIQEILNTNAQELAQMESKLFAQISKRTMKQFEDLSDDLFQSLETRIFRLMMVLLVVQVGVLIASLIL